MCRDIAQSARWGIYRGGGTRNEVIDETGWFELFAAEQSVPRHR